MNHRTYPKDGIKKAKETIQELKARINYLEKENKFLRDEIQDRMKPIRERKNSNKVGSTLEDWKKDFVKRFRKEVLNK